MAPKAASFPAKVFGEFFDPDVDSCLPLTKPKLNKAGKVATRQPKVPHRSKAWWTAQCSFRGLSTDGNVEHLQGRIRDRDRALDTAIASGQAESTSAVPRKRGRPAKTAQIVKAPGRGRGRPSKANKDDPQPKKSSAKSKVSSKRESPWNITGVWDIECDELAQYFASSNNPELSLEVFHEQDQKAGAYSASFDFNVIEGIMRIQPLTGSGKAERKSSYRWRGRDTSENVIQLSSDRKSYDLTIGEFGNSLRGEFEAGGVGKVEFTGRKISEGGSGGHQSAAYEWDQLSEDEYEYESKARWR
jgi:hypothetical protein